MDSKRKVSEPKLLSHRLQFTSLKQFVEDFVSRWKQMPDFTIVEGREKFHSMLVYFADGLLYTLSHDLKEGAARGIDEAISLIKDPDYYETVKNRRKRDRERSAAIKLEQKKEEEKRERHRRGEYTKEERERMVSQLEWSVQYHEERLALERAQLLKLQSVSSLAEDVQIEWGDIQDF